MTTVDGGAGRWESATEQPSGSACARAVMSVMAVALVAGACSAPRRRSTSSRRPRRSCRCPRRGSQGSPARDPADLPVAPDAERVDLAMPSFSDPTDITNPLFPVSSQASVLLLGHVEGQPFRTEVTLLPETRIVEWQGGGSRRPSPSTWRSSAAASRRWPTTSMPRRTMVPSGTSARTCSTSATARSSSPRGPGSRAVTGRRR